MRNVIDRAEANGLLTGETEAEMIDVVRDVYAEKDSVEMRADALREKYGVAGDPVYGWDHWRRAVSEDALPSRAQRSCHCRICRRPRWRDPVPSCQPP